MTEPLTIEFTVDCSVEHAFDVWFREMSVWWPKGHSRSGEPTFEVVVEERVGGRIYELTSSGEEFDWGRITVWEPPARVAYLWHIYGTLKEATDVEITFASRDDRTAVRIQQNGFERLGAMGEELRDRNRAGWDSLVSPFAKTCRSQQGG
jgi:hypothetical protein